MVRGLSAAAAPAPAQKGCFPSITPKAAPAVLREHAPLLPCLAEEAGEGAGGEASAISAPPQAGVSDSAGHLGLGGMGSLGGASGGLADATSLAAAQPSDGGFDMGLSLAGGMSAADLEAHLAATLAGEPATATASAPAPPSASQAPPAGGAWAAGPPSVPSAPGGDFAQQQAAAASAAAAYAQQAASAATSLAARIKQANAQMSMLQAQLTTLQQEGTAKQAELGRLTAAEEGAEPAVLGDAPAGASREELVAQLTAEVQVLGQKYAAGVAEWQRGGHELAGLNASYAQAAAVARGGGFTVPSLHTPPTAVGALSNVTAYGHAPWPVARPRKTSGKYMGEPELTFIAKAMSSVLRRTGEDASRAQWYAHALRTRRVQAAAVAAGDTPPTAATLFPPGAIPSAAAAQAAMLAGTGRISNAVRSRAWESSHHVLGRADKAALNRPRRILNLGDSADVSKSRHHLLTLLQQRKAEDAAAAEAAAAAAEAAQVGEDAPPSPPKRKGRGKGRGKARGATSPAKAEPLDGVAAAALLAEALALEGRPGANPLGAVKVEGETLWTTRSLIDTLATARLAYEDAALTFQAVQSSGPKATELAVQATRLAASSGLLDLGHALGVTVTRPTPEAGTSHWAWPDDASTAPQAEEEGALVLTSIVKLTKGKKQVLAAAGMMPPAALKVLVTVAMGDLPHFIASVDASAEAVGVEEAMAALLTRCVGLLAPAMPPGATPAQTAAATLELLCHWMEALSQGNEPAVVYALLQVQGAKSVITCLLERGEEVYAGMERVPPAAGDEGAEAWAAAATRWCDITDELGQVVEEYSQAM